MRRKIARPSVLVGEVGQGQLGLQPPLHAAIEPLPFRGEQQVPVPSHRSLVAPPEGARAAPALADQPETFTAGDIQADAIDGPVGAASPAGDQVRHPRRRPVANMQIAHLEKRRHRSSAISRQRMQAV